MEIIKKKHNVVKVAEYEDIHNPDKFQETIDPIERTAFDKPELKLPPILGV
jgi:hypothetical protein